LAVHSAESFRAFQNDEEQALSNQKGYVPFSRNFQFQKFGNLYLWLRIVHKSELVLSLVDMSKLIDNIIFLISIFLILMSSCYQNVTITPQTATPSGIESGTLIRSRKDGMVMVYIPAGEFLMGSTENEVERLRNECLDYGWEEDKCLKRGADEFPQHSVYLDAFWMDQTEVTNAMFAKFLNEIGDFKDEETDQLFLIFPRGYPPSHHIIRNYKGIFNVLDGYENYPISGVHWAGANAYCQWAGRRLPTEAEWEKASRGTDGQPYPWGHADPTCILANHGGCNGDYPEISSLPVGSLPEGYSPYGVMNMADNVSEWVADYYDQTYFWYSPSYNPQGPEVGDEHVIKGGSFIDIPMTLRSAYRWVVNSFPPDVLIPIGFRCAQSFSSTQIHEPTIAPLIDKPHTPIPTSTSSPTSTSTPGLLDQCLLDLQ